MGDKAVKLSAPPTRTMTLWISSLSENVVTAPKLMNDGFFTTNVLCMSTYEPADRALYLTDLGEMLNSVSPLSVVRHFHSNSENILALYYLKGNFSP